MAAISLQRWKYYPAAIPSAGTGYHLIKIPMMCNPWRRNELIHNAALYGLKNRKYHGL